MTYITIFTVIGILFTVIAELINKQKKLIEQIEKKYPDLKQSDSSYLISVYSSLDLKRSSLILKRKLGILFYNNDKITVVIEEKKDLYQKEEFQTKSSEVSFIDNQKISFGIPSFIRLSQDRNFLYLFPNTKLTSADVEKTRSLFQKLSSHCRVVQLHMNTDDHETDSKNARLGLLSGLLGLVGLLLFSIFFFRVDILPSFITELPNKSIVVSSDKELLILSESGGFIDQIKLEELGINNGITGIETETVDTILIGDDGEKTIKRCNINSRDCQKLDGLKADDSIFFSDIAIAFDSSSNRIFAADVVRHRIIELDSKGKLIRILLTIDELCFPNQITVEGNKLMVTNTNHHKIQWFDISDNKDTKLVDEMLTVKKGRKTINCPPPSDDYYIASMHREKSNLSDRYVSFDVSSPGRVWPFAVQRDINGDFWVLNAGSGMVLADLLRIDGQTSNPQLILSGGKYNPIDLIARDEDVLVIDAKEIAIFRFDLQGNPLGVFRGEIVKNKFSEINKTR
ncbi:MAG: hypothetical protein GWN50_05705, partial [Candidatus Dadabacteria bacterium]|nr:hypothetical protein [Candidatus Dadabacteria bacterium]